MSLELKNSKLLRDRAYINGQWVSALSGKTFDVINPANGEHLTSVPDMDDSDTRVAIEAADKAWPAWRSTPAKERANILRKWFHLFVRINPVSCSILRRL